MTLISYLPFLFQIDRFLLLSLIFLVGIFIYYFKPTRLLDFGIALVLVSSISGFIKYVVNAPRPISEFVFEGSGFPSTHSATAACVIFFYLLICHTPLKNFAEIGEAVKKGFTTIEGLKCLVVIILGLIVMWLRVVLKAHTWTDVSAGIVLGYLVTLVFMFYDISGRKIK